MVGFLNKRQTQHPAIAGCSFICFNNIRSCPLLVSHFFRGDKSNGSALLNGRFAELSGNGDVAPEGG